MWIRRAVRALGAAALTIGALAGCATGVPDRSGDAQALTAQVRQLPGVVNATAETAHSQAQGRVYFRLYVDVSDSVTDGQTAAITARYLRDIGTGKYADYRLELDLRRGWNVFAVDSGAAAVVNVDQIVGQSRDWTALMREFPSATVALRATITHPNGQLSVQEAGHSNLAELDSPIPVITRRSAQPPAPCRPDSRTWRDWTGHWTPARTTLPRSRPLVDFRRPPNWTHSTGSTPISRSRTSTGYGSTTR